MNRKKLVLLLAVGVVIASGTYLVYSIQNFQGEGPLAPASTEHQNKDIEQQALIAKKNAVSPQRGLANQKNNSISKVEQVEVKSSKKGLNWLRDKDVSPAQRADRISAMSRDFATYRQTLTQFVNSENPYAHLQRKPHSYEDILFQREAALRVHGLKMIAGQLPITDDLTNGMNEIIGGTKDETMKAIAREVLAYKKKGRSFFKDFKNGIKGLKPPTD